MAPNTVNQHRHSQTRQYNRDSSVVFLKTREAFGGLSNMAGGFPLRVNEIRIPTSEALYQACRFPHLADVQRSIIGQKSPMTAKMKSKLYRHQSRPDWNRVRVSIMRWCLCVKLVQNWDLFGNLLLQTGDSPIVEQSRRDDFWGALPVGEKTLVGRNVLGRLLMELRESVRTEGRSKFLRVEPLPIHKFLLGGRPIESVAARELGRRESVAKPDVHSRQPHTAETTAEQLPLLRTLKADVPPRHENAPTSAATGRYEPFPSYPAYKDSGVPWLGEVPAHWEVSALRRRLRPFDGLKIGPFGSQLKLEQMVPSGYKVYGQANVIAKNFAHGTKFVDQEKFNELSACVVLPGDLLVTMMGTIGRCVSVPDEAVMGIMDSHLLRLRTNGSLNVRFASLLIDESPYVKEQIMVAGKGSIMHGLNSGMVKALVLALPPLSEQIAIVRFLDHVDRRIRRYIRAKQKLIGLLEEQK